MDKLAALSHDGSAEMLVAGCHSRVPDDLSISFLSLFWRQFLLGECFTHRHGPRHHLMGQRHKGFRLTKRFPSHGFDGMSFPRTPPGQFPG